MGEEKQCIVQSMSYSTPIAFVWPVPWALFIYLYYSGATCPPGVVYVKFSIVFDGGGGVHTYGAFGPTRY